MMSATHSRTATHSKTAALAMMASISGNILLVNARSSSSSSSRSRTKIKVGGIVGIVIAAIVVLLFCFIVIRLLILWRLGRLSNRNAQDTRAVGPDPEKGGGFGRYRMFGGRRADDFRSNAPGMRMGKTGPDVGPYGVQPTYPAPAAAPPGYKQ